MYVHSRQADRVHTLLPLTTITYKSSRFPSPVLGPPVLSAKNKQFPERISIEKQSLVPDRPA